MRICHFCCNTHFLAGDFMIFHCLSSFAVVQPAKLDQKAVFWLGCLLFGIIILILLIRIVDFPRRFDWKRKQFSIKIGRIETIIPMNKNWPLCIRTCASYVNYTFLIAFFVGAFFVRRLFHCDAVADLLWTLGRVAIILGVATEFFLAIPVFMHDCRMFDRKRMLYLAYPFYLGRRKKARSSFQWHCRLLFTIALDIIELILFFFMYAIWIAFVYTFKL